MINLTKEQVDKLLERWDQSEPEIQRQSMAAFVVAYESLKELLQRLLQWDHFDAAGDGTYWRKEIEAKIQELTVTTSRRLT